MIIALVLGFAITPWNLTKTSFSFTSYLSAYSIFLASICGVLIGDYFLVRKGFLDLPSLFNAHDSGLYYFHFGFHWRGYVAYIVGMIPALPGFLHTCGVSGISVGAQRLYYFGFPIGIVLGAVVYWLLCLWSPVPGGNATAWREVEPRGTGVTGEEWTEHFDGLSREESKDVEYGGAKSAGATEKAIIEG
jgi:nucleobase:cation symporter-1, NCS1 family